MRDHRKSLLDLLDQYEPWDAHDRAQAERIRAFVNENRDCLERSNEKGHLTGSAWLVDANGSRVLLTHHKKLNKWLQLGGHADGNPDLLQVAVREAEEESGLKDIAPVFPRIFDVDIHRIPARANEPAHDHYDIRFALRAFSSLFRISEESHALAWIEIDRLPEVSREESMLRMAKKWEAWTEEARIVRGKDFDRMAPR